MIKFIIFSLSDLQKIFPGIDLSKVLASSGLKEEDKILVTDTGLLNTFAQYVSNEYLGELKTAMRIYILTMFGGTLSTDFVSAQNSFSQAFYGISGEKSIEEIAVSYVQNAMSDYIGEIYIQKYFSEDAKKDVEEMVAQIIKTFKTRINNLSWMSESTKKMALRKLDTMTVKIGYPDKWDTTMDKIEIKSVKNGGSFFSNLIAITNAQNRKLISLQGTPVDKSDFGMTVYTVNAMYNPTANDITFPSGILQAPFYDINASREENLGGIGMVIAHEITHSFDNNGAKFDENGNAANWWTKNDYEVFQSLCQNVINHFDGAEIVPGIFSNGTLTLSENIADLGGLSCALEAAKSLPNPNYKKLFENFAKTWYNTSTREYALYLSQLDVHSANKLRVNLIVQNFDEFYKAYDIKEGDGMYIAPENRVKIW